MTSSVFVRARERARRRRRRYAVVAVAALVGVVALVFALAQTSRNATRSNADVAAVSQQHRATLRRDALRRQQIALQAQRIAVRREHEALRLALIARKHRP